MVREEIEKELKRYQDCPTCGSPCIVDRDETGYTFTPDLYGDEEILLEYQEMVNVSD